MWPQQRGLYRIRNSSGVDSVWVQAGSSGFAIPETRYIKSGYQPDVEELPWHLPDAPMASNNSTITGARDAFEAVLQGREIAIMNLTREERKRVIASIAEPIRQMIGEFNDNEIVNALDATVVLRLMRPQALEWDEDPTKN